MPLAFQEHGQVDSAPGEAASRNRLPREDSFPPRATDLVQSAKWPNPLEARETEPAAAKTVSLASSGFGHFADCTKSVARGGKESSRGNRLRLAASPGALSTWPCS